MDYEIELIRNEKNIQKEQLTYFTSNNQSAIGINVNTTSNDNNSILQKDEDVKNTITYDFINIVLLRINNKTKLIT